MALANYADLKAAVSTWSKRQDVEDKIDDFILLCETEIYSNEVEPLRIRAMQDEETSTTSTSVRTQALPTDFISTRRFDLVIGNERPTLTYQTPETLYLKDGTGQPTAFTVTDTIVYDIVPDQAYTYNLTFFKKLTGLSTSNTTNAIITTYPNVYLYGCLMQLFGWAEEDGEFQKYQNKFYAAISAANSTDEEGNRGVAPQRMRRRRSP